MPSADVQGKFLWHELMTTDPAAAGAFYGKVLGWTPQAWDKDPSYTVLLTPKGPVGGIMRPNVDAQGNAPPAQWLAYIGTANVDETAAAAQRLGGRIVKAATDIPGGGGRYAILADPQGGTFGIHTPPASSSAGQASEAFAWHELATPDHAAGFRFYREIFGWEQLAVHDMGAVGPYLLFGRGGRQFGGMFNRPSSMTAEWPHWLSYVRVASAAKVAETVKAAGGRVANGPHQVPGGSWIAQLVDPQGAAIAVNQPEAAVDSAPGTKAAAAVAPTPASRPAAADRPASAPGRPATTPTTPTPAGAAKPAAASAAKPATAAAAKSPAASAAPPVRAHATAGGKSPGEAPAGKRVKTAARPAARSRTGAGRKGGQAGAARSARRSTGARKRPAAKAASRSRSASRSTSRSASRSTAGRTRTAKRASAARAGSRRGAKAGASRTGKATARRTAPRKTVARKAAPRRKTARRSRR